MIRDSYTPIMQANPFDQIDAQSEFKDLVTVSPDAGVVFEPSQADVAAFNECQPDVF